MKHARGDYDAIQPWPTKRPHIARVNGQVVNGVTHQVAEYAEPLIPDDEPVFLLRAQDEFGSVMVFRYADALAGAGADPAFVAAVREHAVAMRQWRAEHGGKLADAPSWALPAST